MEQMQNTNACATNENSSQTKPAALQMWHLRNNLFLLIALF